MSCKGVTGEPDEAAFSARSQAHLDDVPVYKARGLAEEFVHDVELEWVQLLRHGPGMLQTVSQSTTARRRAYARKRAAM